MTEDTSKNKNTDESIPPMENSDMLLEEVALRHHFLKHSHAQPDVEAELSKFHQKRRMRPARNRIVVVSALAGAAAALLLTFIIHQIWFSQPAEIPTTVFLATNNTEDVTLQSNSGALLSLNSIGPDTLLHFSGAKITAQGNLLKYQDSQANNNSIQTLTTPRKKDFKVILSDGTEVWLNAESQLSYPCVFEGNQRIVHLRGEAYFKVAPDTAHPFIVKTGNLQTEVLGTEFNLRNYCSTDTHVTLVHGCVQVSDCLGKHKVCVTPGQDAFLQADGSFTLEDVDTDEYTEWKNGYFYFDNRPLIEIVRELGRWYDVDIVVSNQSIMNAKVHFIAKRQGTLEEIVYLLNSLNLFDAEIQGKKIVIRQK